MIYAVLWCIALISPCCVMPAQDIQSLASTYENSLRAINSADYNEAQKIINAYPAHKQLLAYQSPNKSFNDSTQNTLLHEAAKMPSSDELNNFLQFLIDKGAPVHLQNKYENKPWITPWQTYLKTHADQELALLRGTTVLHTQAKNALPKNFDTVLQKNNNILNAQDYQGKTPLFYAVYNDNIKNFAALKNAGAERYARDNYGNTVLHEAITANNTTLIKELAQDQKLINTQNIYNMSPLMELLSSQRSVDYDTIQALINAGANLTQKDILNDTILHHLLDRYKPDRERILHTVINKNPELINARGHLGQTPLHILAERYAKIYNDESIKDKDKKEILEALDTAFNKLIENGANPWLHDYTDTQSTPLTRIQQLPLPNEIKQNLKTIVKATKIPNPDQKKPQITSVTIETNIAHDLAICYTAITK